MIHTIYILSVAILAQASLDQAFRLARSTTINDIGAGAFDQTAGYARNDAARRHTCRDRGTSPAHRRPNGLHLRVRPGWTFPARYWTNSDTRAMHVGNRVCLQTLWRREVRGLPLGPRRAVQQLQKEKATAGLVGLHVGIPIFPCSIFCAVSIMYGPRSHL